MASTMTRKEARETVFCLLYETEFHPDETPEEILNKAIQGREIQPDAYVENVFPGVMKHLEELDALIGRFSNGWKTARMSRVSRAVLRLSAYEMLYRTDIPSSVSLNEAVELSKAYDEPRARAFVNGILNSVKNEIVSKTPEVLRADLIAAVSTATEEEKTDDGSAMPSGAEDAANAE